MVDELVAGVGGGLGWGLGLGIAMAASSALTGNARPLIKGVIRGGMWARDHLTVVAAEASERVQDLYHEVQSERETATPPRPGKRGAARRGAAAGVARGRGRTPAGTASASKPTA